MTLRGQLVKDQGLMIMKFKQEDFPENSDLFNEASFVIFCFNVILLFRNKIKVARFWYDISKCRELIDLAFLTVLSRSCLKFQTKQQLVSLTSDLAG